MFISSRSVPSRSCLQGENCSQLEHNSADTSHSQGGRYCRPGLPAGGFGSKTQMRSQVRLGGCHKCCFPQHSLANPSVHGPWRLHWRCCLPRNSGHHRGWHPGSPQGQISNPCSQKCLLWDGEMPTKSQLLSLAKYLLWTPCLINTGVIGESTCTFDSLGGTKSAIRTVDNP
jgi:hypothetical protein